jgi:hypothetical protein
MVETYSNTLIATDDTEVALKIVEGWVRYRAQKRGIQIPSVSVSERHSANNLRHPAARVSYGSII